MDQGSRMKRRWGLQAKMSASYVLVTAAAVVLVEVAVLGILVPRVVPQADPQTLVQLTADRYASTVMRRGASLGRLPRAGELQLGDPALRLAPGEARLTPDRDGVQIPYTPTPQDDARPMSLALLLDPEGRVLVSSYPARYRTGDRFDAAGIRVLVAKLTGQPPAALDRGALGLADAAKGAVHSAASPVLDTGGLGKPIRPVKPLPASAVLGFVYVQVPTGAGLPAPPVDSSTSLWVGLLVLAAVVPVGLVFGLLSTRRLVGRLRRLAATTVAVADGDYRHRVPVAGGDEVAQLEGNFNRMAERLDAAMATERQLAGATERARIARELHDAISQDLFSLRLLAGGVRKALPDGSPLRPEVAAMEQTATATMHEMQALLLELRPLTLEDAGLVPALEELCRAYRERLGVTVDADLDPVELAPPAEHAVLRVVQEALANAVRHAQPNRVRLRLQQQDGQVAVTVSDDGAGFDPTRAERHGMGLGLMRERVAELGGTFQLDSTPGRGTTVRILLPR
jgi:signal transduction histidine kinase